MAATLTHDGELTYFSFPIEKSTETTDVNPVDGTPDLVVYGKATDGTVDSDLQIVDPNWSAKAIQDWLATGGNLRVQHQARRDPAGVGLDVEITPEGHYVKALVTEPVAKHLVRTKTLQDFSIGVTHPHIDPDPTGKAMNGIIKGRPDGLTKISEISLVDRGSNFNSKFQLVKAAGDGSPELVGKMFGETDTLFKGTTVEFGKRHEGDTNVHLTLPEDVNVTFTPGDLAKILGRKGVGVAKRNMDPDVGGGVDRDKIPAKDFAGKNRSFPIVTPGDVSDAASSIGRAGDNNYSADQLKKNIIRIARRKGASFVAELPETWKKELGMKNGDSGKSAKANATKGKKGKKPFEGAAPAFGSKDDDTSGTNTDSSSAGKSGTKKTAKVKRVAKGKAIQKKKKVICPDCGANVHDEHNFCPECGHGLDKAMPIKKNHEYTCLDCGKQLDKGEKYCPNCGEENPGYLPQADAQIEANKMTDELTDETAKEPVTKPVVKNGDDDSDDDGDNGTPSTSGDDDSSNGKTVKKLKARVKKAKKAARVSAKKVTRLKKAAKASLKKGHCPSPADGVEEAASTEPTPMHREPDGPAIEEFEKDAHMTEGDESRELAAAKMLIPGDPEASASMRLKSLSVPFDLGALHDLTCPCYHPDDVAKAYPSYDFSRINVDYWQAKAFDLATSAPIEHARKATELWQHVVTLKNTDIRYLNEIRSGIYKEFADANPGPGTFPTPGSISSRQFNRPLITADHEAPSPGHDGPNTSPVTFGQISAAQFDRDYISAGRAAESPQDIRPQIQPVSAPAVTGVPSRTYYTNAQRDNARQAMSAMHDHIAQTFPDLCPAYTTAGPYGSENLPGSRPVPVGVGGPAPHDGGATKVKKNRKKRSIKAAKAVQVAKMKKTPKAASVTPTVVKATKAIKTDLVKAVTDDQMTVINDAVNKAVASVQAERDKEIVSLKKRLKKTNKLVDSLGAQPDPNGPYRGVAFDQIVKASAAPEVLPSIDRAERARENMYRALHEQWRTSPDPMQREVAWAEMMKMTGVNNTLRK